MKSFIVVVALLVAAACTKSKLEQKSSNIKSTKNGKKAVPEFAVKNGVDSFNNRIGAVITDPSFTNGQLSSSGHGTGFEVLNAPFAGRCVVTAKHVADSATNMWYALDQNIQDGVSEYVKVIRKYSYPHVSGGPSEDVTVLWVADKSCDQDGNCEGPVVWDPYEFHTDAIDVPTSLATSPEITLIGYGDRTATDGTAKRRYGTMKLWPNYATSPMIYLKESNNQAGCNGDSGAPLLMDVDGVTKAIGVLSIGDANFDCSGQWANIGYSFAEDDWISLAVDYHCKPKLSLDVLVPEVAEPKESGVVKIEHEDISVPLECGYPFPALGTYQECIGLIDQYPGGPTTLTAIPNSDAVFVEWQSFDGYECTCLDPSQPKSAPSNGPLNPVCVIDHTNFNLTLEANMGDIEKNKCKAIFAPMNSTSTDTGTATGTSTETGTETSTETGTETSTETETGTGI